MLNELRSVFEPIAEFSERVKRFLESEDARNFLRDLQSVAARMQEFDSYEQDEAFKLAKTAASHGLIVPISQMSFNDYVLLVRLQRESREEECIEQLLVIYDRVYQTGWRQRTIERWSQCPAVSRRLHIIEPALMAHEEGKFVLSVPVLLAQFEGLVAELSEHSGRMGGAQMNAKIRSLSAHKRVQFANFLYTFTVDAYGSKFEHNGPIPPFSRHAVLHGGSVDYGTQRTSRTIVLAIGELLDTTADEKLE